MLSVAETVDQRVQRGLGWCESSPQMDISAGVGRDILFNIFYTMALDTGGLRGEIGQAHVLPKYCLQLSLSSLMLS